MLKQIKIGLIILFLSTLSYAQDGATLLTLMSDDASYDADAQAYFDAMSTPLSTDYQDRINTFVLMVKDSLSLTNLSDKFDVIYLLANETSEAGLKNLVKRSSDANIEAATVTFTADEGFTGDGTGYINTDYNASTQGVAFETNNNSFGVYCRTNLDVPAGQNKRVIGNYYSGEMMYFSAGTNDLGGASTGSTIGGSGRLGSIFITKTALSTPRCYHNGVDVSINPGASNTSIYNARFVLMAHRLDNDGAGYEPAAVQLSFAFFGAGLDAVEARKLNNCIEWYMDDLGTGVE